MAKGHKPGGGIKSRQKVEVGYRHGQQKKRTIPAGVAQMLAHVTAENAVG